MWMRSVYFASAALLVACTVEGPDESQSVQRATGWNRLASNRLASNRLASNRLASNRLASNSLSSTRLEALQQTAQILETPEGRDVYSYIIGCALPDGMTIEADVPGAADTAPPDSNYTCASEVCTFSGSLGLAPRWIEHRLDRKGQGWVSACLFARVNANDTAEAISLRGRNEGLAVSPDEAALYTVEEGAFYGNLFIDDPDPSTPPDWNACRGEGQASGEFGGLVLRDCAEENPATPGQTYCGFNYAGDCADFTPASPSAYACRTYDAGQGTYGDCHDESGLGQWGGSTKYREVITTWTTGE
jgi:hypothetical protein